MDGDNTYIVNEFDCPILLLTTDVYCVRPAQIQSVISIVHMCGTTCTSETVAIPAQIEREQISTSKLFFNHDLSNHLFCFNIYCIQD